MDNDLERDFLKERTISAQYRDEMNEPKVLHRTATWDDGETFHFTSVDGGELWIEMERAPTQADRGKIQELIDGTTDPETGITTKPMLCTRRYFGTMSERFTIGDITEADDDHTPTMADYPSTASEVDTAAETLTTILGRHPSTVEMDMWLVMDDNQRRALIHLYDFTGKHDNDREVKEIAETL